MKSYAPQQQRQHRPEASHRANLPARRADGHQDVKESPRASAEALTAGPGASAADGFAHDFSRIPASSRALVAPGPGGPLEAGLRQDMERRLGRDFSRVRVHDDRASHGAARALGAHAFTLGQDVYFAEGQFSPATAEGGRLLAHELAHTVQQSDARPESPGVESAREDEADRASREPGAGAGARPLTVRGLAVARQPAPPLSDIDAEIYMVTTQLQLPVLHPAIRYQLQMRLQQLRVMRSRRGPPATTRPGPAANDAALEAHINDHPAWTVSGGKGTPEGYSEMEANTSGDDFVRSELFTAWYFKGWAGIRARPNPGKDLETLALQLIPDPAERQEFLASVSMAKAGGAAPAVAPRSLGGALDLSNMSTEEKRSELDAIRVWRQRSDVKADERARMDDALGELLRDLENTRLLEEASGTAEPVKPDTRSVGVGPGFSGASGPYGNVDIAWMEKSRTLDDADSPRPSFRRYLQNGSEISESAASNIMKTRKLVQLVEMEPSIGAADQFVVLPKLWQFSDGDPLVVEWWVLLQHDDPGKNERWRRVIINNHRMGPLPADDGMGTFGNTRGGGRMPTRAPGVRGGARPPGDSSLTSLSGPQPKPPKTTPTPTKPTTQPPGSPPPSDIPKVPRPVDVTQGKAFPPPAAPARPAVTRQPYVNNNRRATSAEVKEGTWLDGKAQAGELKGVARVEGAAEVKGTPSGDYRFVKPDGTKVPADLAEPKTTNIRSITSNIYEKSGQAKVVVVKLGEGTSGQITVEQARTIAQDVLRTPGHSIERVIITKDEMIIVDLP